MPYEVRVWRMAVRASLKWPWPPVSNTNLPPGFRDWLMARKVDSLVVSSRRIQCRAEFDTLYLGFASDTERRL